MNIKPRAIQVLGGVLLLVGCGLSILILRAVIFGHIGNIWNVGVSVWLVSLSAYLVCSGLRMVSPKVFKPFRFGWGKIILGSSILFGQVGSHYGPTADGPLPLFKPSNPTQAASMKLTSIVISLISVYLIFRGIRTGFARRESRPGIHPPQSPDLTP